MANHSISGQTQKVDRAQQRIAAGTVGGTALGPRSVLGKSINSVVDDQDPAIVYGSYEGLGDGLITVGKGRANGIDSSGTYTYLSEVGSAIQYKFSGTSIGILGRVGSSTSYAGFLDGTITIYVDGVRQRGKVPQFSYLDYSTYADYPDYGPSETDTTWYVDDITDFTIGEYYIIDDEVIQVLGRTSLSGNRGTIAVARAQENTQAAPHNSTKAIWAWASKIALQGDTTYDIAWRRLLWYVPRLPEGEHIITIVVDNSLTTNSTFVFDGFLVGSLIGNENMNIEYGTVTFSSTTYGNSDANGYVGLPTLSTRSGTTIIGLIGFQQISPDPNGANAMFKINFTPDFDNVGYDLVDGPGSSAWTVQFVFAYISESV